MPTNRGSPGNSCFAITKGLKKRICNNGPIETHIEPQNDRCMHTGMIYNSWILIISSIGRNIVIVISIKPCQSISCANSYCSINDHVDMKATRLVRWPTSGQLFWLRCGREILRWQWLWHEALTESYWKFMLGWVVHWQWLSSTCYTCCKIYIAGYRCC